MQGNADTDFAYKYPFSNEAKSAMEKLQMARVEQRYLKASESHIKAAMEEGIEYRSTSLRDVKQEYIIIYVYSRMLLSAAKNMQLISSYAAAEAARSARALSVAGPDEMGKLVEELGLNADITEAGKNSFDGTELKVPLEIFLRYAPRTKNLELVNQRLSKGKVSLSKDKAIRFIEETMKDEIAKGLPISAALMPKEIAEFSKTLKFAVRPSTAPLRYSSSDTWIDRLLQTPIPDIRHRSVNLILAPYLVNNKNMTVEDATKTISEYIERCKKLDPSTRINESYIRYQCTYAKKRGLRPLSLTRAKELFSGTIDIDALVSGSSSK